MAEAQLLVGDIGGTNARFALADNRAPGFRESQTLKCADFPTAYDAIERFLSSVQVSRLDAICLAAAGPVAGDSVDFTNNHWSLDVAALRRRFGTDNVDLLNDFEAVACALPWLRGDDVTPIGPLPLPQLGDDDFSVAVVGPGTGMGSAGLKRSRGRSLPMVAEGGHIGFAPANAVQAAVLARLQDELEFVCVEHLVSGPGVERLYAALAGFQKREFVPRSAADIFASGLSRDDATAAETVELFFELLGQVAGDLALVMGAWDGVYIAGGVAARYPDALLNSRFRAAFEKKGDYGNLMAGIPTALVTMPQPGLLGASATAFSRLASGDVQ